MIIRFSRTWKMSDEHERSMCRARVATLVQSSVWKPSVPVVGKTYLRGKNMGTIER